MLETKRIEVEPKEEAETITVFESFGWKMVSRSEIYDAHQSVDGVVAVSVAARDDMTVSGGKVISHEVNTHFVALLFQRDSEQPHYAELKESFDEYTRITAQLNADHLKIQKIRKDADTIGGWRMAIIFGPISSVTGFLSFVASLIVKSIPEIIVSLVVCLSGMALLFVGIGCGVANKQKNKAQAEIEAKKMEEADEPQREKALTLLGNASKLVSHTELNKPNVAEVPAPKTDDALDQIAKAKEMLDKGAITEDEFKAIKAKLLK